jgi:hypothetical protein
MEKEEEYNKSRGKYQNDHMSLPLPCSHHTRDYKAPFLVFLIVPDP